MHGEDAPAWAHWLELSALGEWARAAPWGYAAANGLHVLGIGALFGAILAFDLRVLGAARAIPLPAAAGLLLPLARAGLVAAAASGVVLLAADASHVVVNPAFQAKMALLGLALLNVLAFHRLVRPLDDGTRLGAAARVSAALSLALWPAAITCGRLIAYL